MALRSSTRQSIRHSLQRAGEMTGNGRNGVSIGNPLTRLTQEDQDNADEDKQRESIQTLVGTWLESLQLISVITTFFVATEASWLVVTVPVLTDDTSLSTIGQLANIGIMSALILHGFAAMISFLAAFSLIRHKLAVAQNEEEKIEDILLDSPKPMSLDDPEKAKGFHRADDLSPVPLGRVRVNSSLSGNQIIWSSNPHLVQVGPFQRQPPTELLARCHSLCVSLSFLGFLLALMGAISFTWDRLPRSIGISASVSTIFCVVSAILILVIPSTQNSHIFYDQKSR